jgi:hypothetical protein
MSPILLGAVKIDAMIDHGERQGNAIAEILLEKNQRSRSGQGTAVVNFEAAGEKQRRASPIICSTVGVP